MSKRRKSEGSGAMLDLWRAPQDAGEPIGCLATTYTFATELFDEQCLARFLEIESEPDREDLAFLLERESRLGSVYAGVLVDHTQAGVAHSLRWDVLPVRLPTGKQHSKLSLLTWSRHVRLLVASANLTEPGYRTNYEVAVPIDLSPQDSSPILLADGLRFLRKLLGFVPGYSLQLPEVQRAESFLNQVELQVSNWAPGRRPKKIRQQLVFTLPATDGDQAGQSSLEETVRVCRARGGSPQEVWVASPFFDEDSDSDRATAAVCKAMARGERRDLRFCVPAALGDEPTAVARLAAPKSLLRTPKAYQTIVSVETLPEEDPDKNRRPWHAKLFAFLAGEYSSVLIGSSNFTCAGLGIGLYRNAEANLLTLVDWEEFGRETGRLESVWPESERVPDPENAEWLGNRPDPDDATNTSPPIPAGFLSATYRAGDRRQIVLRLDPPQLPPQWVILSCGHGARELLSAASWWTLGSISTIELAWESVQPPEKLLVQWEDSEGFLPLNVEDGRSLPPLARLEQMTADEMLGILAAADPSAAFRAWAKARKTNDGFDEELDSAIPVDLNPLHRYDLKTTFLHRVRTRARFLALLRLNLQRSVWGRQALEWRLRGLVGIEPLADRLVREFIDAGTSTNEAMLALSDFLIVLCEVDYQPDDGALPKEVFQQVYLPFLRVLAAKLRMQVDSRRQLLSAEIIQFWDRVMERCLT